MNTLTRTKKAGIKDAFPACNREQLKETVIDHHMQILQDKLEWIVKFETREACICCLTVFDYQVNSSLNAS